MQTSTVGGLSVTLQTALAVKPHRPAGPSVVMMLTADPRQMTITRAPLIDEGSDKKFRQMLHDTLAFAARIEVIRAGLGAVIGLPGSAYTVLITVAHLGRSEEVGISAVAEHLHLSGAAVTIEVNRLVRLGMIRKRINPSDRRRVRLGVTDKARAALEELKTIQAPTNDALFACLDRPKFNALASVMGELVRCADDGLALLDLLKRGIAA